MATKILIEVSRMVTDQTRYLVSLIDTTECRTLYASEPHDLARTVAKVIMWIQEGQVKP